MAKEKENFKNLSEEELKAKRLVLYADLKNMRFKVEGSKSKNVKEERNIRKQIARLLTELNKKK